MDAVQAQQLVAGNIHNVSEYILQQHILLQLKWNIFLIIKER